MDNPYERRFIHNYEYYIENRLNDTLEAVLNRGININYVQGEIIIMKETNEGNEGNEGNEANIIYTPLEYAYKCKNIVAMELLLYYGFDPNMKYDLPHPISGKLQEHTEFSSILGSMEFEIAAASDTLLMEINNLLKLLIDYGGDIDYAISHVTKNYNKNSFAFAGVLTHREVADILLDMIDKIVEEHKTYKAKKMLALAKSQPMISDILSLISENINTLPHDEYYTRFNPGETYDMFLDEKQSKMLRDPTMRSSKRRFAKRTKKRKTKRY